jgi:hypothetical protein
MRVRNGPESAELLEALHRNLIFWLFEMMTVALNFGELGLVTNSSETIKSCIANAQKAYSKSLAFSSRVAFTSKECGIFDYKSHRIEALVVELQGRLNGLPTRLARATTEDHDWRLSTRKQSARVTQPLPVSDSVAIVAHELHRRMRRIDCVLATASNYELLRRIPIAI